MSSSTGLPETRPEDSTLARPSKPVMEAYRKDALDRHGDRRRCDPLPPPAAQAVEALLPASQLSQIVAVPPWRSRLGCIWLVDAEMRWSASPVPRLAALSCHNCPLRGCQPSQFPPCFRPGRSLYRRKRLLVFELLHDRHFTDLPAVWIADAEFDLNAVQLGSIRRRHFGLGGIVDPVCIQRRES